MSDKENVKDFCILKLKLYLSNVMEKNDMYLKCKKRLHVVLNMNDCRIINKCVSLALVAFRLQPAHVT